jgi:hypothetical protein
MATVDTSIYNTPRKSAFEYLQEMDAADAAKQAKESNRLALLIQQGQYQDQTQARARGNQLRTALQGLGPDAGPEQQIGVYQQHGEIAQANALRKALSDQKREAADTEKVQLGNLHTKLDRHLQALAMVNTPQDAMAWLQEGVKGGTMDMQKASGLAAQLQAMNPQQLQGWKQQMTQGGLSLKEQVEQVWKQKGYDLDVRKVDESARHNKAQEGLTARAQNLADSRAREGLAQAESQFQRTQAAASDKPLNDVQSKALLFGSRMQEADKVIGKLISSGTKTPSLIKQAAESVPGIGGALGMAANATVASDSQQQMEQAQRDFINATLRRESGAVISEAEFDNARKQYFPQPGDSPAVMAQKAKNRTLATKGILAEVPERKRSSLSEPSTGGATGSWGEGWKIEKAQ